MILLLSQHVHPQPSCPPHWCSLTLCWWAAPHAWHHAQQSTEKQWVTDPWPVWWSCCGLGCSTGSPEWWTGLKDAFQQLGTREPKIMYRNFLIWLIQIFFLTNNVAYSVVAWKGWDSRSDGSSLKLLQGTTVVLPKSKKTTYNDRNHNVEYKGLFSI